MGQRIIGLTGGIATGKTTVSRYLADRYGLPVLDADLYARQAVAVGSPILTAIAQRYGTALLHADGSLNRPALGRIIFNHGAEKQWVEAHIHPFVRQCFDRAMAAQPPEATVVQAIPLLFEAGLRDQVTEVWVVTCDEATQLQRLRARDGLDATAAIARIRSQWPLAAKAAQADVVLSNNGPLAHLYHQVDQVLG